MHQNVYKKNLMVKMGTRNELKTFITAFARAQERLNVALLALVNDDKEFMTTFCVIHHDGLKYASDRLKDDDDFVAFCCSKNELAIKYASERLQKKFMR